MTDDRTYYLSINILCSCDRHQGVVTYIVDPAATVCNQSRSCSILAAPPPMIVAIW